MQIQAIKGFRSLAFYVLVLWCLPVYGQHEIHLFYTGDIHGVLKSEVPGIHGDILRVEAAMKRYLNMVGLSRKETLLLDTGDALAAHYLSQLDSGQTVFRHLMSTGYDAMTPGDLDFRYGRKQLEKLAALDSGFVMLTSNILRHDNRPLFSPYRIFERQGIRIGLVGIVEERVGDQLLNKEQDSIKIAAPAAALKAAVDSVRNHCDLVVALNHMDLDDNMELCRQIPGIDILISKYSGNSPGYLRVYDDQNRPRAIVVNAPTDALAIGHLEVAFSYVRGSLQLREVRYREPISATDIDFSSLDLSDYDSLESRFRDFVRGKYGEQASPDQPLAEISSDWEKDLMNFSLYAMLKSTRSEIAILNYGALVPAPLDPTRSFLTIRDVAGATRPNDPVVTLRLAGRSIKAILGRGRQFRPGTRSALQFMAVGDYDGKDADLKPHSLNLNDDEVYAVTTTHYLAEGGDGYAEFRKGTHRRLNFTGLTRLLASEDPSARPVALGDLLIRFLQEQKQPGFDQIPAFLQGDDFLNQPLLLMTFQNIDFSFKSVSVSNNEGFTNANDKRVSASTQNATNIASSGYLALIRRTLGTRWENGALIRYGFQQIGQNELQESDDRLELQTILDWDDPLGRNGAGPRKVNFYASMRYDTEFTPGKNAEGGRIPKRQDGFLYAGISRFGKNSREWRLAFFAKNDFVNNNRDAGFEFNLKYFRRLSWANHGSLLRGRFLFIQPGRKPGSERALLDYTGYFEFNIIQFINLKPQFNIFLFQDMALQQVASNFQFAMGLSFSRLWKPQYIRFWRADKT